MDEKNGTFVEELILKGFSGSILTLRIMFTVLLLIYIVTLTGNILIIIVISRNVRLHSPMYFFLICLACMEVIVVSTVVPKLLAILITQRLAISRVGCYMQSYIYYFVSSADTLLLTAMSIDRYIALCFPLRYSSIMTTSTCIKLLIASLVTPFLCLLYPTIIIPTLAFCGHELDHFFCEGSVVMKLFCADVSLLKLHSVLTSTVVLMGCLVITVVSYVFIVVTVIRMPSDAGRQKTFSTCLSHLIMLSVLFGSAIFILIRPPKEYSVKIDKSVNLVSTVLAALLNPFVYTLRNQKVKDCIRESIKHARIL